METDINNQVIQSLWIGGQLSNVEKLCVQSFLDHGHEFHLYAYEEIKNLPKGAHIVDARTIIDEKAIFRYESGWGKGSVSGFADLFRLLLVQKNGGWWVDMDIVCLKRFDFAQDMVFCSSYENDYGQIANNCVFKSQPDSDFIKFCLDEISKIDLKNMSFGLAGPFLFQSAIKELKLQKHVAPYYFFNPIGWKNVSDLVLGNMTATQKIKEVLRPVFKPGTMHGRKIDGNAYAIHLWNEVWNSGKLDKNATYSSSSLFEKLKRTHGIK